MNDSIQQERDDRDIQVEVLEYVNESGHTMYFESFDLDLEWSADERSADFVSAVGAVF